MTYSQYTFRTPGGNAVEMAVRGGDTNDFNVTSSLLSGAEYPIRFDLAGWAVDIGSHVGGWAISMAVDNPGLRVVAVEAIAENCELIRHNVALNELTGRVIVLERGATTETATECPVWYGYQRWGDHSDEYVRGSRFIGNQYRSHGDPTDRALPPPVGLAALMAEFGMGRITELKIDCEGCEWNFLSSPAVALVDRIVGEYHAGFADDVGAPSDARAAMVALLSPTHIVTTGEDKLVGGFTAVVR